MAPTFIPFFTYCYISLDVSLQFFLNRPNFLNQCQEWRKRNIDMVFIPIYMMVVFGGNFRSMKLHLFTEPGNLGLMMNLDFFQPYKHIQYSMGAVYLTVLNLPRTLRYNQENTILVGLIPGPNEPHHDLNSFLKQLVENLLKFWDGIELYH